MKNKMTFTLVAVAAAMTVHSAFGLSRSLSQPEIYFPKGYDTNRVARVHAALRAEEFKYLGGLVSYWEPEWSTTLVYDGDAQSLTAFLAVLNEINGIIVRLTFSPLISPKRRAAHFRQAVGGLFTRIPCRTPSQCASIWRPSLGPRQI